MPPWVPIEGMVFESIPLRHSKIASVGARFLLQKVPVEGMMRIFLSAENTSE